MKKQNWFLFIGFLFIAQFMMAQSENYALGKVTIEELQKPFSTIDSSAVAEYLFLKGSFSIDYNPNGHGLFVKTVDTKIKIYKTEGYDYATFTIPISKSRKKNALPVSEAFTYNFADGEIEVTKLESEGIFIENANSDFDLFKFTMPNVKIGSIVEFRLQTETSGTPYSLPEWFFQRDIPTVFNELVVTNPVFYGFRTVFKPYHDVKRVDEVYENKKKKQYIKSVFTAENINAVSEESFVSNMENFITSVKYELATHGSRDLTVTWDDITQRIFTQLYDVEFKTKGYFEKELYAFFTEKEVRPHEKLMAVFTFVKEKMTWNKKGGFLPENGVKKAYKNKIGNVADINLMLVAMLNDVGIVAFPVVLSTRDHGVPLIPSVTGMNYVIAAAKLPDGGYYLLDATNKYALPQILPLRCLNGTGRMIAEKGNSHEIDLMPVRSSRSYVTVLANISSDGVVSGKMRDQMTDYYASNYRENFNDLTKQSMIEKVQNQYKSLEILDHKILNKTELSDPVIEEYEFVNHTSVEIIAGKMYILPTLHYGFRFNPFKAEKRNFPVDFTFPKNDKYLISLKIPEGYAIESLPEPLISTLGENTIIFKYQVSLVNTTIQVSMSIDYNQTVVEPENYESLKAFFGKMAEKQSEQIVLKKL